MVEKISKRVSLQLPNTIKIYDHYYRKKVILQYRPDLILSRFKRFEKHSCIVYSRDTEQWIDIDKTLESQEILPGDCLDVVIKRKHNEIENINYSHHNFF